MRFVKLTLTLSLVLLIGNAVTLLVVLPAFYHARISATVLRMASTLADLEMKGAVTIDQDRLTEVVPESTSTSPPRQLANVMMWTADDSAQLTDRITVGILVVQTGVILVLVVAAFKHSRSTRESLDSRS
ncbi:MAG: hypothetical protein RIB60_02970 [Phycisphaerales bacterium]